MTDVSSRLATLAWITFAAFVASTLFVLPPATAGPEGKISDKDAQVSDSTIKEDTQPRNDSHPQDSARPGGATTPTIITTWNTATEVVNTDCHSYTSSILACVPPEGTCERDAGASNNIVAIGGRLLVRNDTPGDLRKDQTTLQGTTRNLETGETSDAGFTCSGPASPGAAAESVVITVTQRDFASLPVQPLAAHAGPDEGWLPVNMVNVLHTDPQVQTLETELLGTPVAVRAIPISYHWDLGDGNTITTTKPGKPYPSEEVSATYAQEGWYDITLTTTFAGQFSVNGGQWQDIDGTIEIASEPVEIFSKSLESRLVNGDVPVDEDEDPWIPPRTPDTEGPKDPDATHREL